MEKTWSAIISSLGRDGHAWFLPSKSPEIAKKEGRASPLEEFVKKLRCGEDMPASDAMLLADIIEGHHFFTLALVPVRPTIKRILANTYSIAIGAEIQRLIEEEGETVSSAVSRLADYLDVEDRTVWRHWKRYGGLYDERFTKLRKLFKPLDKDALELRSKAMRDAYLGTDKK